MESMDVPTVLSNSSLYPMLLATLMAQQFTPQTKTTFHSEYDYIVVGSGSAGSVVASRLSENPADRVLLLEAGPPPPAITEVPAIGTELIKSYLIWKIQGVPQKHAYNKRVQIFPAKTVGGSSSTNYMYNVRGNRRDYDIMAANGAYGWSYEEVLPYFKKLEDFRVPKYFDPVYHGLGGPLTIETPSYNLTLKKLLEDAAYDLGYDFVDSNAATQLGIYELNGNTRNGRRCSTAKAYLIPADQRENLNIVANAFVTKVVIRNKRATGVEVEFNGASYVVRARKEVILSAGALHTPQILMLSGIGPKEHLESFQIPVEVDLPVGKDMHDHFIVQQEYEFPHDVPTYPSQVTDPENIKKFIYSGTGALTSLVGNILTIFTSADKCDLPSPVPDYEIVLSHGNFLKLDATAASNMVGSVRILHPSSRGSVKLNSTNPYDPPLVDSNFFSDPQDIIHALAAMRIVKQIISSEVLRSLDITRNLDNDKNCLQYSDDDDQFSVCLLKKSLASANHFVATAKMGDANDPSTVVDPELRVKGIDCLRVVDASIFPQVPSGNSQIPTVMAAEKASDIIKVSTECLYN